MPSSVYGSADLALGAALGQLGTGASQPLAPGTNPLSRQLTFPDGTVHTVQPLVWGGDVFYDQPTFRRWAGQHGTTVAAIFKTHPEAQRIYDQLAPETVEATVTAGETIGSLRVLAVLANQSESPAGDLTDTMQITFEIVGRAGNFTVEVVRDDSWPSYAVSAMLDKAFQVQEIYALPYGG